MSWRAWTSGRQKCTFHYTSRQIMHLSRSTNLYLLYTRTEWTDEKPRYVLSCDTICFVERRDYPCLSISVCSNQIKPQDLGRRSALHQQADWDWNLMCRLNRPSDDIETFRLMLYLLFSTFQDREVLECIMNLLIVLIPHTNWSGLVIR